MSGNSISAPKETASAEPQTPRSSIVELDSKKLEISEVYGPFAEERLEVLTNMGKAQQLANNHEQAIIEFHEALQVQRIQAGLDSPAQIQLINAIIESHRALLQYGAVDDLEALSLHVVQRSFPVGSDTLNDALARSADWNIEYFQNQYLYQHQSDVYDTRVYRGNTRSIFDRPAVSKGYFGNVSSNVPNYISSSMYISKYSSRLTDAETSYASIVNAESSSQATLIEAYLQLAKITWLRNREIYYLFNNAIFLDTNTVIRYRDAMNMESKHYRQGRTYLQKRLELVMYNRDSSDITVSDITVSDITIANAMLDIADWDTAFYRSSNASDQYTLAYEFLLSKGFPSEDIENIFQPDTVVMIPTFVNHRYDNPQPENSADSSGVIEIELDMRKYGRAINIRSVSYSEDTGMRLRNTLRNYILQASFRPKIVAGKPTKQDNVHIRYLYQY